jgi:SAM-dependent methyltransferase
MGLLRTCKKVRMMNPHLNGKTIYGDDFTFDEIKHWYEQEKEAYADLGNNDIQTYSYGYHELNKAHGFCYLEDRHFENVLGLGAAWGHEFYPIADRITNLYIIEPSATLRSDTVGGIKPVYSAPDITGKLNYPDNYFDLVTCFGTLHHIPNVSYVLSELCRVTRPGGFIMLREPIISMGNWALSRKGLTANERGIPLNIFRQIIAKNKLKVIHEGLCFTMTAFFQRKWIKLSGKPLHAFKGYILFDKWLSKLLSWNVQYHARHMFKRIAPQAVFYVLRKS